MHRNTYVLKVSTQLILRWQALVMAPKLTNYDQGLLQGKERIQKRVLTIEDLFRRKSDGIKEPGQIYFLYDQTQNTCGK
jgi:hypothetical protein